MSDFPRMADVLSPRTVGKAEVSHVVVSEHEARMQNMRCSFTPGGRYDMVTPGTYARLVVGGTLMMSDTDMERITNREFARRANGRVLIAGLGLGMIVHPIAAHATHVTVIEKSADVVTIVAPTLPEGVTVICADVFDWAPPKGETWDTIYFDIWPDVSTDNLDDIARLSRKFARRLNRANAKCWMGAWRKDELRARRDQERRSGW